MRKYTFLMFVFITGISHAQVNTQSITQTFREYVGSGISGSTTGYLTSFTILQETEGSPYLLKNWAKGKIYLKNNSEYTEPTYSLNFNKEKKVLVMKVSESTILEIDMKEITGFDLDDNLQTPHFVYLPDNKPGYFVELHKDSLFSLYKTIDTKFYKSDYVNKGLYETGYKYNRYVDESKYYIKSKDGKMFIIEGMTKKDLKKLSDQLPAAKDFLAKKNLPVDTEAFLIDLTIFLNAPEKH